MNIPKIASENTYNPVPQKEDQAILPNSTQHRHVSHASPIHNAREASSTSVASVSIAPTPHERVIEVVEMLQEEHQIGKQFLEALGNFLESKKTIACLRILGLFKDSEEERAFMSQNPGEDFDKRPVVLNNSASPVLVTVANNQDGSLSVIAPTIIPMGSRNVIQDKVTTAPNIYSTHQEDLQVRGLILNAVSTYYGENYANIVKQEFLKHANELLTVGNLKDIFKIFYEKDNGETLKINKPFHLYHPNIPVSLAELITEYPALSSSDETQRQKAEELFNKAEESLSAPEKSLLRAFCQTLEGAARTAGVVSATALTAGLYTLFATSLSGSFGFMYGGLGGALGGVLAHGGAAAGGGAVGGFMGGALNLGFLCLAKTVTSMGLREGARLIPSDPNYQAIPGLGRSIDDDGMLMTTTLAVSTTIGGIAGNAFSNSDVGNALIDSFHSHADVVTGSVTGAVSGIFSSIISIPINAVAMAPVYWKYFSPETAFKKVGEAFCDLRGETAKNTLTLLKEAQITDQTTIEALESLFSEVDFSKSKTSYSTAAATAEVEGALMLEVPQILKNQIHARMGNRATLIEKLKSNLAKEEHKIEQGLLRMRPVVRGI